MEKLGLKEWVKILIFLLFIAGVIIGFITSIAGIEIMDIISERTLEYTQYSLLEAVITKAFEVIISPIWTGFLLSSSIISLKSLFLIGALVSSALSVAFLIKKTKTIKKVTTILAMILYIPGLLFVILF